MLPRDRTLPSGVISTMSSSPAAIARAYLLDRGRGSGTSTVSAIPHERYRLRAPAPARFPLEPSCGDCVVARLARLDDDLDELLDELFERTLSARAAMDGRSDRSSAL